MTAVSHPSSTLMSDYSNSPLTYVPLDKSGRIIRERRIVYDVTYMRDRTPANLLDRVAFGVMGCFEGLGLGVCPMRRERATKTDTLSTTPTNQNTDENNYYTSLRKAHPHGYEITSSSALDLVSEPTTSFDPDLLTRIKQLLIEEGITVPESQLETLLNARERAREELNRAASKTDVFCVSAHSPYLAGINNPIRQENKGLREKVQRELSLPSPPKYLVQTSLFSTASVRVFPQEKSSITLPGEKRMDGGTKTVRYELLISGDTLSVMRRSKLRSDVRDDPDSWRLYHTSLEFIRSLSPSPYVLTPSLIFNHPTQGMQCLTMNALSDFFNYLNTYADFSLSCLDLPANQKIYQEDVSSQILTALKYMKHLTLGAQHLQTNGFNHNDMKPDNSVIKKGGIAAHIDLDLLTRTTDTQKYNMGSPGYSPRHPIVRNVQTELYALARMFWMNLDTPHEERPSFMHIFDALLIVARNLNDIDSVGRITALQENLKILCDKMRNDKPSDIRTSMTYDDVLLAIDAMERPFLSRATMSSMSLKTSPPQSSTAIDFTEESPKK